jgi:hypothetical protein
LLGTLLGTPWVRTLQRACWEVFGWLEGEGI